MPLLENDIPIIEKFLENSLTSEEQLYFNERSKDQTFVQELEAYQQAHKAVILKGRQDLRATFSNWDQEIGGVGTKTAEAPSNQSNWMKYLLGFLIIAGLCCGIYFLLANNKKAEDALDRNMYAANFEAYPNVIAPLQKGAPEEDTYKKAFQLYESGAYDNASKAFANLDQSDEAVQFYQAMNAMASKNYKDAALHFSEILKNNSHRFFPQTQWYSALIHLQNGKMNQMKNMLTTISEVEGHIYRKKATTLLQEL